MKMLNYIWIDLKVMFRIPLAIFFSLVYPIVMTIIILISYGNVSIGNGFHLIDKYFFISMGMGILPLTIISFPMWISNSLDDKSMKRLMYFDVKLHKMVIGDISAHLILAIISLIINTIFSICVFGLKLPATKYLLIAFIQVLLAVIGCMLIGAVMAFVFKSTQIVMSLGLILMFVVFMFCGVFITYDQLPPIIKNISQYIPMKYVMNDFFYIWIEKSTWNGKYLLLSSIFMLVSCSILVIAIKIMRRGYERSKLNG